MSRRAWALSLSVGVLLLAIQLQSVVVDVGCPSAAIPCEISAIAPDGAGGAYLGGSFSQIGGVPRAALAHVTADGVIGAWNPNAGAVLGANPSVSAMVLSGSTLYLGGSFGLAAVTTAGASATWNADTDGYVYEIVEHDGLFYIAGEFTSVNGIARDKLAAVAADGTLASWNPDTLSTVGVFALAVTSDAVFAGGSGQLEAFSRDGMTRLWSTPVSRGASPGSVRALAVANGTVYAGGTFDGFLLTVRTDGMLPQIRNPFGMSGQYISALAIKNSTLYIGGDLNTGPSTQGLNATGLTVAPTSFLADNNLLQLFQFSFLDNHPRVEAFAIDGELLFIGGNRLVTTSTNYRGGRPGLISVRAGSARAMLLFDPPPSLGEPAAVTYRVTAQSSEAPTVVVTGTQSPITVTGLVNGVSYRFSLQAVNSVGAGPAYDGFATPEAVFPATWSVGADGGSVMGRIKSEDVPWTASTSQSWLTISPSGAAVTADFVLTASPTTTVNARSAVVTFSDGQTIPVTQAGGTQTFSLDRTSEIVGSSAGNGQIALSSTFADAPWTASSDSSWVTVSPTSGGGSGTITFTYGDRGPTTIDRTAILTIAGRTFTLTQRGTAPTFTLSPAALTAPPGAMTGVLQLTSNIPDAAWTAGSNVPWIALAPSSGIGSAAIGLVIERNPNRSPRSGSVTVGGSILAVTQRENGTPAAPATLNAQVNNFTVRFFWTLGSTGGDPLSYAIEIGSGPGARDFGTILTPTASREYEVRGVPPGRYFARVRAQNEFGIGEPSGEFELSVGAGGSAPPDAPVNLVGQVSGSSVALSWSAATGGGAPTDYVVEAGTSTGLSDVAVFATAATSIAVQNVPNGVYFVRVRGRNGTGVSVPSVERVINVGGLPAPPGSPQELSAVVAATTVTLSWSAPIDGGPPTRYAIEVGSTAGASNLAVFETANAGTTVTVSGVPPGVYYVRVRALNALGSGGPSNEVRILVTP